MFDRHRRARPFILGVPPLILALLVLFNHTRTQETGWAASLIALAAMIAVMVGAGGIKLDDVGLDRDMSARGIGITLMTWAATQVIGVLPRVAAEDPVAIHRSWLHGSGFTIGGNLITALSAATLAEVALRGFLLVQLYLLFHRDPKDSTQGVFGAVALTLVVGNAIALLDGWPVASTRALLLTQAIAAGTGLYLSWIYLRTRNLFFAIGVHTLILAPTPVVAGLRGEPKWFFPVVVGAVAAVWVLLWPRRD
jgi:hypothetical protein